MEDIALVRAKGSEVDDDNEPAPENISPPDMPLFMIGGDLHEGQEWGWGRMDQQAGLGGGVYNQPMFTNSWTPHMKKFVDIVLHLFPVKFLETVIAKATSRVLLSNGLMRTTIGEMLRYIRMMLLMSCYMKPPDYFWRLATRTTGSEDKENDTIVHLQQVHVAAPLLDHHIDALVHDVGATNLPRQVLLRSRR